MSSESQASVDVRPAWTTVLMRALGAALALLGLEAASPSALAQATGDYTNFSTTGLPGRLYVPPASSSGELRRPLVLALHGGGGIGTDNSRHLVDFGDLLEAAKTRGAFLYVPQATSAFWYAGDRPELIMRMIDQAIAMHAVDPERVYVTGFSMGGGGAWNLFSRYRDRFAAVVPIAAIAPGSGFEAGAITGRPTWAFHARNDSIVPVATGRNTVSLILADAGRTAPSYPTLNDTTSTFNVVDEEIRLHYTEWPDGGHPIWWRVYRTTALIDWMFQQTLAPTLEPPRITKDPESRSAFDRQTVVFTVEVSGSGPLSFQWKRNGADIVGATMPNLTLTNVQPTSAGSYTVVVSNPFGSVTSDAAMLTVTRPRLVNLSARALAGSGEATLIIGFFIDGTGEKTLIIRGLGPELIKSDVENFVIDPQLTLFSGQNPIESNDDADPSLAADFAAVGATVLDAGSKDAAMKVTLSPGGYTVHLVNPGPVAEAVVELFDLSKDPGTRFTNLSTRLELSTGQTIIVGTFFENATVPLIIRNAGPALGKLPPEIRIANFHPDPRLQVFSGQSGIASNDDWDASLVPNFLAAGASPFAEGSKDAAVRMVGLAPGGYTFHATGNGKGIVLVELFENR